MIWLGVRYYDSCSGRFLSPDPVSYPNCLDLYVYANGDPINYTDLDGRFESPVYQARQPVLIEHSQAGFGLGFMPEISEILASYCARTGYSRSTPFYVGAFDLPKGAIGFINGIQNEQFEAMGSALQLSRYAQGAAIYGVYNATNLGGGPLMGIGTSMILDVLECVAGRAGIHTPPVQMLKDQWNRFFTLYGPQAKFLQICHSGGAGQVKRALLSCPRYIQQGIIVLSIAPSDIIPKKLCYESYNYVSRRDVVTHLDIGGKKKYGNQLRILEPHPNARLWDHEFLSPTFAEIIQDHILEYIRDYGDNK